jgi:hypothetical protein
MPEAGVKILRRLSLAEHAKDAENCGELKGLPADRGADHDQPALPSASPKEDKQTCTGLLLTLLFNCIY